MKLSVILENLKLAKQLMDVGKISKDILDKIVDIDPTPTKKFSGWMAKQYIQKNIDDFDDLRNTIEEFYSFLERGKTKDKDIFRYKTFQDVKDEVKHLNDIGADVSDKDLANDYETVIDDNQLLVMVPHTHEASRKLGLSHFKYRDCGDGGKDSAWCTTYKAPNHFNDYYYKHNVTFYYIKVKSPALIAKLEQEGYGPEYVITAIAVLDEEKTQLAADKGLPNMDAYDALDKQFQGEKLKKYLDIIGLK